MKELNNNEMQAVSGAGFLSDFSGNVAGTLGGYVDSIFRTENTFADGARKIAEKVAGYVESGFGLFPLIKGLFGSKDQ